MPAWKTNLGGEENKSINLQKGNRKFIKGGYNYPANTINYATVIVKCG
jgi:hypothetical protein